MNYFGYKKYIKSKLQYLKDLRKNIDDENLPLVLDSIDTLKCILSELNYQDDDRIQFDLLMEEDFQHLKQSSNIWPSIYHIAKMPTNNIDANMPKLYLRKNDLESLVYDFFKDATDDKSFKTFLYFFKSRRTNICISNLLPDDFTAESYYLPFQKEGFIHMHKHNDISCLCSLSHEYGHLIQNYHNYDHTSLYDMFPFREIVSIFFELLASEYFSKNGLLMPSILYQLDDIDNTIKKAKFLKKELYLFHKIGLKHINEEKERLNMIQNYLKGNYKAQRILSHNPSYDYPYIIGELIACELFMIYLNDPDKAFYLLYKLIDLNLKMEPKQYFEEIHKLNLGYTKSMKDYNEYVKRKLTKI